MEQIDNLFDKLTWPMSRSQYTVGLLGHRS